MPRVTLKAQLRPQALTRLQATDYRFCFTPACPVVYFGTGSVFQKGDVLSPVFQKEPEGARIVCYCFGIGEERLVREIQASDTSPCLERVTALVQADRCACEVRNPQGSCCLGNMTSVIRKARAIRSRVSA